jgi:uncharacterized protein (TIGR02265 family)
MEARLPLATTRDCVRGLFLNGILDAVHALGDGTAVRHCQVACGHERFLELLDYPISVNLRLVSTAMYALAVRQGGTEEALRRLGRRAGLSFLGSPGGRALLLLGRGNPKRLLSSLPLAYQTSVSFGERTVTWVGHARGLITMKREFLPAPFHEGTLLALLDASSALNPKVVGRQRDVLDSEYEVSWD